MVTDRLKTTPAAACEPTGKPPHIIMVHDELAFDIRNAPNIRVPQGYGRHFRSFDGKQRDLVVEAAGGPSWYTEYNVFAGLSARSFGKFSYFVTRIAAGRVERGLPNSLRRCGYRTFSLYPAHGAFMATRTFQASTGVQNFFDRAAMRAREVEPDSFYYDTAIKMFEREREKGPTFFFIYLSANHFPWDYRWRPELTRGLAGSGQPSGGRRISAAADSWACRSMSNSWSACGGSSPANASCWCAMAITSLISRPRSSSPRSRMMRSSSA